MPKVRTAKQPGIAYGTACNYAKGASGARRS